SRAPIRRGFRRMGRRPAPAKGLFGRLDCLCIGIHNLLFTWRAGSSSQLQLDDQGVNFVGRFQAAIAQICEHLAQMIACREQSRHQTWGYVDFTTPKGVENVLSAVPELYNRLEPEKSCRSLDRVKRAKNLVQQVLTVGCTLELDQILIYGLEQLLGFGEECLY